jgi:ABC-type sugar transport system ATPase subunit
MALLQVQGIGRREGKTEILKAISFEVDAFRKMAIAGASGSGKTSLLKVIAGLLQPHEGQVLFKGVRVKGPDEKLLPGHPGIAYLSQHFELRNHYRVEEMLDMENRLSSAQTQLLCSLCRIDHLLQRRTHQLSGGERQRVALARQLLAAPELLLLDEPFSNLDAFHRRVLKEVIADLESTLQLQCILVSHEATDLLSWADTILVMEKGRIIQADTPENIYRKPLSRYTAELFGACTILTERMKALLQPFSAPDLHDLEMIRPEQGFLSSHEAGAPAKVISCSYMGSYYVITCLLEDETLMIHHPVALQSGEAVHIQIR